MSCSISRKSWKQCALLLILLSHAVFGSPMVPSLPESYESLSSNAKPNTLSENTLHTSLEEDVFGPTLDQRSNRKKRLLFETFKKAKKAKLLGLGAASGGAVKSVGKSLLKTVATFGIKAIIFNFLYSKINQVLDFKTRLLNNLEDKNREQNSQVLGTDDSSTAGSELNTTTENPALALPQFDPNHVMLAIPDAVFPLAQNITTEISRVFGTFIQNTGLRIFRVLEALQRSSSRLKSKKRETQFNSDIFDDTKLTVTLNSKGQKRLAKNTSVKSSNATLTSHKRAKVKTKTKKKNDH